MTGSGGVGFSIGLGTLAFVVAMVVALAVLAWVAFR
jgi:hypothetical protein